MKRRRLKVREGGCYHLLSRTVNGERFLGDREKEVFRKMMWQVAEFSGARVLTYAIMDNHFHILAEVPEEAPVDDAELVRRYRALYPEPTPWNPMTAEVLEGHLAAGTAEGRRLRRGLLRRMHDVSWMMKTLKQRFAIWFNASNKRYGPVWSGPFKSLLVQSQTGPLATVAAYIDLNAVRAGKCADPKDYRFCGYAEALAGPGAAREGLGRIEPSLALYRQRLFGTGSAPREGGAWIDPEKARAVIDLEKGELPLHRILRHRLRFLSEGMALGEASFVEALLRPLARGRKRPPGPRPLPGMAWRGNAVAKGSPR